MSSLQKKTFTFYDFIRLTLDSTESDYHFNLSRAKDFKFKFKLDSLNIDFDYFSRIGVDKYLGENRLWFAKDGFEISITKNDFEHWIRDNEKYKWEAQKIMERKQQVPVDNFLKACAYILEKLVLQGWKRSHNENK